MFGGYLPQKYDPPRHTHPNPGRQRIGPSAAVLAVVVLAVSLAATWPYVKAHVFPDDVTANIADCRGYQSGFAAIVSGFIVDVHLHNRTGYSRKVIVKDAQGNVWSPADATAGDPDWITLQPHETRPENYHIYAANTLDCKAVKVSAVVVKSGQ